MTTPAWTLQPGEHLTRRERSAIWGGALFGGIESSDRTPNVFCYNDPSPAGAYGYDFYGWVDDDTAFQYTGDGQIGDQLPREGNLALMNAAVDGKAIRLFVADGTVGKTNTVNQLFVGTFRLDPNAPYVRAEAPDRDGGMRTVYVFRLLPVGQVYVRPEDRSSNGAPPAEAEVGVASAADAQLEHTRTERAEAATFGVSPTEPTVRSRTESALIKRYEAALRAQGHVLDRWRIKPPGALHWLYTDTYDQTAEELYEAKGTATRDVIRLALGQVLDYARFVRPAARTVLLPSEPPTDLIELLAEHRVGCVWETTRGVFVRAPQP